MQLTIQVRAHNNAPAADQQRKTFDQFPIVIGRSSACHYRLEDESRYISARHATLAIADGQVTIEDTSSNGVFINGSDEPVGRGRSALLEGGETLLIGDYQLIVEFSARPPSDLTPIINPFDDALASNAQAPGFASDPFDSDDHDWTPPSEQSTPLNDPFDMWDESEKQTPVNTPAEAARPSSEWPTDWDDSQVNSSAPEPVMDGAKAAPSPSDWPGDDFDWATESDEAANAVTRHNDAQAATGDISTRNDPGKPAPHHATPADDGWDSIPSHPEPAAPKASVPQAAIPPQTPRGPSPDQFDRGHAAAVQAGPASIRQFLMAAGLNPDDPTYRDEAAVLIQSGRMLSQSIDAMMLLLRSRAEMKNAFRSEVTMISRNNNNPLKISLTSSDALNRLLAADDAGYMNADDAIREAVEDLKLHQVAMLDGMKAAVKALLKQFDPDKLGKKMERKGGIGANIPITREAKLWEMFCEQYDTISEEAVTDFDDLFGNEFRKAYEKRTGKLDRDPDF